MAEKAKLSLIERTVSLSDKTVEQTGESRFQDGEIITLKFEGIVSDAIREDGTKAFAMFGITTEDGRNFVFRWLTKRKDVNGVRLAPNQLPELEGTFASALTTALTGVENSAFAQYKAFAKCCSDFGLCGKTSNFAKVVQGATTKVKIKKIQAGDAWFTTFEKP